jgi:choline dehydrogenase-like flavoprotein
MESKRDLKTLKNPIVEQIFDAVVIGSGFGGTIAAITLSNYFLKNNKQEKVCLLERGQWWLSHEIGYSPQPRTANANMREFLQDKRYPYNFWAHPDNTEGLIKFGSKTRLISRAGLYDYRSIAPNVAVICASGVGGGSLVYSNVTLEPPEEVYRSWGLGPDFNDYLQWAKIIIGTNKITTVAGLGKTKLIKSQVFQDAAWTIHNEDHSVTNGDAGDQENRGYALDLSITDVPLASIENLDPGSLGTTSPDDLNELRKLKGSQNQNVCERQGRCNLGCLPGARHTLNKRIFRFLQEHEADGTLTVKPLCEAYLIEPFDKHLYRIHFKQYDKENGTITPGSHLTKRLVVAAGTLGSAELLLKSAVEGNFHFSKRLGKGFSTDGDLIGFMRLDQKQVDNTRGPINTSHALFKATRSGEFSFSIEDTTIPKMVAPIFATLFELVEILGGPVRGKKTPKGFRRHEIPRRTKLSFKLLRRLGLNRASISLAFGIVFGGLSVPRFQNIFSRVLRNEMVSSFLTGLSRQPEPLDFHISSDQNTVMKGLTYFLDWMFKDPTNHVAAPEERLAKYFIFSCMGRDKANGKLSLRPEWQELESKNEMGEKLILDWSATENAEIFDNMILGIERLAGKIEDGGENRVYLPTWNTEAPEESSLIVLHPLGGCSIGSDVENGVVNNYGQVFRSDDLGNKSAVYENLYVMDGSIVPGALGVNSSLTIAALALRCIEHLVGSRDYWPDFALLQQVAPKKPVSAPTTLIPA